MPAASTAALRSLSSLPKPVVHAAPKGPVAPNPPAPPVPKAPGGSPAESLGRGAKTSHVADKKPEIPENKGKEGSWGLTESLMAAGTLGSVALPLSQQAGTMAVNAVATEATLESREAAMHLDLVKMR